MRPLTIGEGSTEKYSAFTINPSSYVDARVLAAGVAEVVTVPATARSVLFSCSGNFYARHKNAAAIPVADVTDGAASILNPSAWMVYPAETIGVIAPSDCVLTLEFFT